MNGYTFKDLAKDVLLETKEPMSDEQIWSKACELGIAEKVGTNGKTPSRSIGAQLYTDIRDNEESPFVKLSKHPVLFGLKMIEYGDGALERAGDDVKDGEAFESGKQRRQKSKYNERDLHPLLVTYVRSAPHFKCYAKTIYQEQSTKKKHNADKWTHPDIVGVYFPVGDFEEGTISLQNTLRKNPIKLYSFELKKSLATSNLRECFFQAVSNSSWANEGYLVAASISQDSDFLEDLQRLSNAFGVGVIRLDIAHADQSEILFPAAGRDDLDWPTVDRLASINPNFRDFIEDVNDKARYWNINDSFDKTLEGDEYEQYLKKHGMNE